jgi:ATP synthase protein I
MADEGTGNGTSKDPHVPGGKGALGDLVKAETMIQLAIALPAGCLIGWLLGSWLDRHFHQHWFGIAGIVLGAVAGFIQIFTMAARYLKRG